MVILKLQSAMEYLMTYGWGILIIAIVLAVLYSLGVFNLNNQAATVCQGVPGYSCQGIILSTQGYLSFELSQNTGTPFYNMQVACVPTSGNQGPYIAGGTNPFQYISTLTGSDVAQPTAPVSGNDLGMASGQSAFISNVVCYSSAGNPLNAGNTVIGSSYQGSLYINYTINGGAPTQISNPWQTTKIATISVRVT